MSIIDIGSNSVRLVIYEGLSRSPTVLFNEKILCGLGRGLSITGRLDDDAVVRAKTALVRFKALSQQARASEIHILATAAAREAENGPEFIDDVEAIFGQQAHVLSGREEAHYSALGVICGFTWPDGIMGDMGGGSLELVAVEKRQIGDGITTPLGGLRLADLSENSLEKAKEITRDHISKVGFLSEGKGRNFYTIGGTWRALARLHMNRARHPLQVMHNYEIDGKDAREFCRRLIKGDLDRVRGIETISANRRALLPYGAVVMNEVLRAMKPARVVVSALGVREGYLYSLLDKKTRKQDPLLVSAGEMAVLRARSATHAHELADWSGEMFSVLGVGESQDEARLRRASCLLADIGWRAYAEYRGEQSFNIISNAAFVGVDHPGRAYLALANYYRHEGLVEQVPKITSIATDRIAERARLLGLVLRVAYLFSASMPGIVPMLKLKQSGVEMFRLEVPVEHQALMGERLIRRVKQLANLRGIEIGIVFV